MTAESRGDIEAKLKDLEDKSGIQLVVATVKSLQGSDIETYANRAVPVLEARPGAERTTAFCCSSRRPSTRSASRSATASKATLTDALSSVIISSAIIPRFKTGDFSGGIERGVDGIISVLSGDTADWQPKVDVRNDDASARFR